MLFQNKTKKGIIVRLDDKTENTRYKWITVEPGKDIELRAEIGISYGLTKEGIKEKVEEKKDEEEKFSKTDLIDKTKEEQIKILEDFGVDEEEIKKLTNEKKRVNKILKIQNAKDNK